MVSLADIQAAYYMVAATGVLVAAIYYVLNIRQTIENRKAQLFTQMTSMNLQKDWLSNSLELLSIQWSDFDDFARKYDSGVNPDHYVRRTQVFNYLEQVGYYVRNGQLDVEQISTINGGGFWVVWLWVKYSDIIKRYRELLSIPEYYVNFEYLADRVTMHQREKGHEVIFDPGGGVYNPDNKQGSQISP